MNPQDAGTPQRQVAKSPAPVTSLIVNGYSAGGIKGSASIVPAAYQTGCNIKAGLSGVLTSNALATMLTVTGAGYLDFAAFTSVDATSRTHHCQIMLDGVIVFDATSAACTAANDGIWAIGSDVAGSGAKKEPQFFSSSCIVKYASSVTETNLTNVFLAYRQC